MPTVRSVQVLPAGGSLNTGAPPALLRDNEYQDLLNYYSWSGRLRRRGGSRRIHATGLDSQITKLHPFLDAAGGWHMVIGHKSGVAYMDEDRVIRKLTSPSFPDGDRKLDAGEASVSLEPWGVVTRDDQAYMYRSDRTPLRLDVGATAARGSLAWAGLTQPPAPVISDGGAGTLPAATWRGVIVYYTSTGNHSAYSAESNTLVLGANKKVKWDWTLPASGDVAKVGLFRTLADQTGAWYRVALVNASLLTYTEDVAVESMGAAAVPGVFPPERGWYAPAAWKQRLWATDGRQVFPSEHLLYETFRLQYGMAVGPNDGSKILGLHPDHDRLYVIKDNGLYYVTGDGPSSWAIHELDRKRGGVSGAATGSKNGMLIMPGFDALYSSNGGPLTAVKEGVHTKEVFAQVDMNRRSQFQAALLDHEDLYILIPRYLEQEVASEPVFHRRALVYSLRTGDVTTFRWDLRSDEVDQPVEVDAIAAGIGPDKQPGAWIAVQAYSGGNPLGVWYILTIMDNWPWDDTGDPASSPCPTTPDLCGTTHTYIKTRAKSKNFGSEGAGLVGLLRLWLMTSRGVTRAATITATPSGTGGMSASRTVDLPGNRDWQAYGLATRQAPADAVAITVETATDAETDIDGFTVELVDIRRASRAK